MIYIPSRHWWKVSDYNDLNPIKPYIHDYLKTVTIYFLYARAKGNQTFDGIDYVEHYKYVEGLPNYQPDPGPKPKYVNLLDFMEEAPWLKEQKTEQRLLFATANRLTVCRDIIQRMRRCEVILDRPLAPEADSLVEGHHSYVQKTLDMFNLLKAQDFVENA